MSTIEGIVFVIVISIAFINQAKAIRKYRSKIKEQAAREYDKENSPTLSELRSRLGESEMMYEDLEETYWIHISILSGLAAYFLWNSWITSIILCICVCFIGIKHLSLKPFSAGIVNR